MYSYDNRVSYSCIDRFGEMSTYSIMSAFQDGCMFHNSEFGHSPLQLLKKDRAWLVSSWHAIFNKKPILDEEFTVNTWPYKFKGVFGNWSQTMTDKNGQILAATDSVWFYFNTKKEATGDELQWFSFVF